MKNLTTLLIFMTISFVIMAQQTIDPSNAASQKAIAISSGEGYSLVLMDDNTVWAWGNNIRGQLGDGSFNKTVSPIKINLSDVIAIDAQYSNSIALKKDGTVWTWGDNEKGQLGDGTNLLYTPPYGNPFPVQAHITDVKAVAVGNMQYLALKNDGTLWSWGSNEAGQLGDGTIVDRHEPVQVQSLKDIKSIAVSDRTCIALKNDGTVWTWGNNEWGQLGDGTADNDPHPLPLEVKNLTNVKFIASGQDYMIVIKNDGTLWIWGANNKFYPLQGVGKSNNDGGLYVPNPTQVKGLTGIVDASDSINHILTLDDNGVIWAWGNNNLHQLGLSSSYDSSIGDLVITTPTKATNMKNVKAISAGDGYSLAIKNDGSIWGWGNYTGNTIKGGVADPIQIIINVSSVVQPNDVTTSIPIPTVTHSSQSQLNLNTASATPPVTNRSFNYINIIGILCIIIILGGVAYFIFKHR